MSYFLDKVVVGNAVVHPKVLRRCLKKSSYWLDYDPEEEKIILNVNRGDGGEEVFEIRNASYENAVKLAEDLGLKGLDDDTPLLWQN